MIGKRRDSVLVLCYTSAKEQQTGRAIRPVPRSGRARSRVTDMLRMIQRRAVVGLGIVAVGVLAVACSGRPSELPSINLGGSAQLARFSIRLTPLTSPLAPVQVP